MGNILLLKQFCLKARQNYKQLALYMQLEFYIYESFIFCIGYVSATHCTFLPTVCDVLPLIINNPEVRLPANLLYQYLHKAAEFYIGYLTRSPSLESQHQGKIMHI